MKDLAFWKRRKKDGSSPSNSDPEFITPVSIDTPKTEQFMTLEEKLQIFKAALISRSVTTSMIELTRVTPSSPIAGAISSEVVFAALVKVLNLESDEVFPGDLVLALQIALSAFAELSGHEEYKRKLPFGGSSARCAHLIQSVGFAHGKKRNAVLDAVFCVLTSDQLHSLEFVEAMAHSRKYQLPVVIVVLDRSLSAPSSGVLAVVKHEIDSYADAVAVSSACSCDPDDLIVKLTEAKKVATSGGGPVVVIATSCDHLDHQIVEVMQSSGYVSLMPDTLECLKGRLMEDDRVELVDLDSFESSILDELKREREGRYLGQSQGATIEDQASVLGEPYNDLSFDEYQGPRHLGSLGEALDHTFSSMLSENKDVVLVSDELRHKVAQMELTDGLEPSEGKTITVNFRADARMQLALGMSLAGTRPIVEVVDSESPSTVLQHLSREHSLIISRTHNLVDLPLVIRAVYGGRETDYNDGLYSMADVTVLAQSLISVVPSTPADAVGLVTQAFACKEPIVVLENRQARSMVRGETPESNYRIRVGKADVIGEGRDLTIITCGILRHHAHSVAEQLFGEAYIEVIDLRSLNFFDTEAISASVTRCSKVLILGEREGDFATRVASYISERSFWELDAPIKVLYGVVGPISELAQTQGALRVMSLTTIEKAARELLSL